MKRLTLCALALLAAGFTATARADVLADIKAHGKIVCGLTVVQPYMYLDPKTREPVGYEVDLCKLLAQSLGVTMDSKVLAADTRVPELVQGRVDVLDDLMSYTKERAEVIDFSNAYVNDGFYFIVQENSPIHSMDELAEKRIAVAKGSNYEVEARRRFPKASVISFDDGPLAFLAMQQGKVAATIQRASAAMGLQLRSPPGAPKVRLITPPLLQAASGFGVRKNEPAFLAYLNKFLDQLEASGQGQALWDKWLGANSDYKLTRAFKIGQPIN